MNEEHISLKSMIAYVRRNESSFVEKNFEPEEEHLAVCDICHQQYETMKSRYDALGILKNPEAHLQSLNLAWKKQQKRKRKFIFTLSGLVSAALLFIIFSFVINYRFDHSEKGLADVESDHIYSLKESHYRGNEDMLEPDDINDFKKAVILLFDSREYICTIPVGYNMEKVIASEKLLMKADTTTQNLILKNRIRIFLEKINKIRDL